MGKLKDLFKNSKKVSVRDDSEEIIAMSRISKYNPETGCMEKEVTTRSEYERGMQEVFDYYSSQ